MWYTFSHSFNFSHLDFTNFFKFQISAFKKFSDQCPSVILGLNPLLLLYIDGISAELCLCLFWLQNRKSVSLNVEQFVLTPVLLLSCPPLEFVGLRAR